MTTFGPINTGQSGIAGALGGISTGVSEFLRAAEGMMALQKAKHDETQQQGTDLLNMYAKAAHGKPQMLDDPNFQAQVMGIAGKLGMHTGGAGLPGSGDEVAGILGLPTAQDVLGQPGVMADVEQTVDKSGAIANIEARLGRSLTDDEKQRIMQLPTQYTPAASESLLKTLDAGASAAEKTAATTGSPEPLIEYYRSRQPMYEKLLGKEVTNEVISGALSTKLGQMTPLQLSQLAKNNAMVQYLKDKGIDLEATRQARISELNSRSAANNARASYTTQLAGLIPAHRQLLEKMGSFYDGRSDAERATAQQTREEVQTYIDTGMLPADISKSRAGFMTTIDNDKKALAADGKTLAQIRTLYGADSDDYKQAQQYHNTLQAQYNSDVRYLNELNARFAKGLPQMQTQAGGAGPPVGATTPTWVPPAGTPSSYTLNGKPIFLKPDNSGYVYSDGTPAE